MTEKFAEFLTDLATYHAAERYWRERFAALPCDPFANGWEDWGTPGVRVIADESCSVYGAVHQTHQRGIVIVMCKPSEAIQRLTAWTATWGEGWQDTSPLNYLKINLRLASLRCRRGVRRFETQLATFVNTRQLPTGIGPLGPQCAAGVPSQSTGVFSTSVS